MAGSRRRRIVLSIALGLLLLPLGFASVGIGALARIAVAVSEIADLSPPLSSAEPPCGAECEAHGELAEPGLAEPFALASVDPLAEEAGALGGVAGGNAEAASDAPETDEEEPEPDGTFVAEAAIGSAPVLVGSGFASPVFATGIPGDPRLFIVEKAGRVRILVDGATRPTPFIDIASRVQSTGSEQGLLGLAFDPDHSHNGLFYLYYTAFGGDMVLSRFELGSDANEADPGTEETLLTLSQPFATHNGGTIAFSPEDGFLYVAPGDGGSGNDPQELAQDGNSLLGKILRLDVSGGPGTPYAIPPGNPFVGNANVRDEIWALGLRNPYRFAFDWETGDAWIADVGQRDREEVNFQPWDDPGGVNYGWDVKEGFLDNPNDPALPPYVNAPPFTDPIYDYEHSGGNCSITGGSVYRGPLASIQGEYFFGDYCTGSIWSIDRSTNPITVTDRTVELIPATGEIFSLSAIGEGGFGALYIVLIQSGNIFRIGPTGDECSDGMDNDGDGTTDLADPGCADAADPSELDTEVRCDDGYDNDQDGPIDRADPDCPTSLAAGEGAAAPPGGGPGGGGGGGGGCGLGAELSPLLLLLLAARRGRRRA